MKKLLSLALVAIVLAMPAAAFTLNEELPIAPSAIPAQAKSFLAHYFPSDDISIAMYEREIFSKEYTVILESGNKVKFNSNGEWQDVDIKRGTIPAGIVPVQIANYVKETLKGRSITDIKRDSRSYEIDLDNGMELKFDSKFRVVEFDD